jgi:hypothetical protein
MKRCPRCQAPLSPGLRYGQTHEPVTVRICWDCGWETPELPCCNVGWSQCPCGESIYTPPTWRIRDGERTYCSKACAGRHVHSQTTLAPYRFKAGRPV